MSGSELEVGGTFLLSTLYITLHELVQPSCQYFQKIFLSFLLNKNISWQIPIIFQYERDMRGYRQGQWLLIRPNLLCLLFWPVSSVLSLLTLSHCNPTRLTSLTSYYIDHPIKSNRIKNRKSNKMLNWWVVGDKKYQVGGAVYLDDYSFFVGWVGNFTSFTSHFR